MEEWRECHADYDVSNLGRVRRRTPGPGTWAGRILKNVPGNHGYAVVNIKREAVLVHLLVAAAFLGPKPEIGMEIDHKDNDRMNPSAGNIEWVTHQENIRRAFARGRHDGAAHARGEDSGTAKLSEADVLGFACSQEPASSVAKRLGVTTALVSMIRKGRVWGWLTGIECQPCTRKYRVQLDIEYILSRLAEGATGKEVGDEVGVSDVTINRIRRGLHWQQVA